MFFIYPAAALKDKALSRDEPVNAGSTNTLQVSIQYFNTHLRILSMRLKHKQGIVFSCFLHLTIIYRSFFGTIPLLYRYG